jgi:hypothetical protein
MLQIMETVEEEAPTIVYTILGIVFILISYYIGSKICILGSPMWAKIFAGLMVGGISFFVFIISIVLICKIVKSIKNIDEFIPWIKENWKQSGE